MDYSFSASNILPETCPKNCLWDLNYRAVGMVFVVEDMSIGGTGVINLNVFKVTGTIRVLNSWYEITEVTTLTNMTNVYADVYDGTNTINLTKSPGVILSDAPVGTFFTKDKATSETYTISLADQVRVAEASAKGSVPFYVTQKNGADTFIRFNFTTTDNPINFKMTVWFEYQKINGGTLELAS